MLSARAAAAQTACLAADGGKLGDAADRVDVEGLAVMYELYARMVPVAGAIGTGVVGVVAVNVQYVDVCTPLTVM